VACQKHAERSCSCTWEYGDEDEDGDDGWGWGWDGAVRYMYPLKCGLQRLPLRVAQSYGHTAVGALQREREREQPL
jgi:hypothetical protein